MAGEEKALMLAGLILDILATHAFPVAIKIINTLTGKDDDLTLDLILDLKSKVPSIEDLEAEMGVKFEEV